MDERAAVCWDVKKKQTKELASSGASYLDLNCFFFFFLNKVYYFKQVMHKVCLLGPI